MKCDRDIISGLPNYTIFKLKVMLPLLSLRDHGVIGPLFQSTYFTRSVHDAPGAAQGGCTGSTAVPAPASTEHWFGWAPLLIFNVEYLDSSLSPQGAEHVDVSIINDKCSSVCNFISGCLDKCGVEPQGACLLRLLSTAGVYK